MTEVEDTEPQADSTPGRAHRKLGLALIVVASLLTFLAIFAVWANRQLLNTDNWTDTSTELLENDAIRTQIGAFLVESLYANVDVKGELEEVFEQVLQPAGASTLAGPAASGLRSLADQRVEVLLQRPARPAVVGGRQPARTPPPARNHKRRGRHPLDLRRRRDAQPFELAQPNSEQPGCRRTGGGEAT